MQKTIQLNPFEPAALSLRAPAGLDLLLTLTIRTVAGGQAVIGVMQPVLELASRTGAVIERYAGTDQSAGTGSIVAYTIPGDRLKDANGYRLRLVGWIKSQLELLAMGEVAIITGTEGSAIGGEAGGGNIGEFTLEFVRGDSRTWQFTLWANTAKTIKSDLTGAVVTAQIRAAPGDPVLAEMDCAVQGDPKDAVVWMSISASQTAGLPVAAGYWDMNIAYDSGEVRTPIGGTVRVVEQITESDSG